jgi:hypothetical protein
VRLIEALCLPKRRRTALSMTGDALEARAHSSLIQDGRCTLAAFAEAPAALRPRKRGLAIRYGPAACAEDARVNLNALALRGPDVHVGLHQHSYVSCSRLGTCRQSIAEIFKSL